MSWLKKLGFSLFTEPGIDGLRKISLGRLAFTIIFLHSCVLWSMGTDILQGELSTLWILLGYVAGSKALESIKALKS